MPSESTRDSEPVDTEKSEAPDTYQQLRDRIQRMTYLIDAGGILHWDQQVMMPDGGAPARSKQQSALMSVYHDLLTDEETGELLEEIANTDLTEEQQAVVRETRRSYEQEIRVPGELVEEITRTSSEANQVWKQAKAEDAFEEFAPTLETIRDLHIERAEHIDPDRDPYQVMFEGIDPDLPLARVEEIFADLREALIPLIEELQAQNADLADPFADEFDEDIQEALSRELLDELGYDWDRGRLDTSPHPFTAGPQYDCRITTRFRENDPFGALMATIHEFGHATYQLGLPQKRYGTPLGQSRGRIHESQSRFWENHVGRTKAFWDRYADTPERIPRDGRDLTGDLRSC